MPKKSFNLHQSLAVAYMLCIAIWLMLVQERALYYSQHWQIPFLFSLFSLYLLEPSKKIYLLIQGTGIVAIEILLYKQFDPSYYLLIPALGLKGMAYCKEKRLYGLLAVGVFFCSEPLLYMLAILFLGSFYFYETYVTSYYQQMTQTLIQKENTLHHMLESKEYLHKGELERFALQFENQRLAEKSRLSQALHDRLGHSINGSIFQLEACKLMVHTKPEETEKKLQVTIDHLRGSMDEIRQLLREEKPKASQINEMKLRGFLKDFEVQYGIKVELVLKGQHTKITDPLWKVIMECLFETFSNALKYSGCDRMEIRLIVFNQIVRFEIEDNGKGCQGMKEGMGISGIKERVWAVGGSVHIESDNGFCIYILLPLA